MLKLFLNIKQKFKYNPIIIESFMSLLARFSLAALFWTAGQTKIEGLQIDFIQGIFEFGWPNMREATFSLFAEEYRVPLISYSLAAYLAAFIEHFFSILLLVGLFTRLSACIFLAMTLVIQLFIYPDAYPTHGIWAVGLLYLIIKGGRKLSLDAIWQSTRPKQAKFNKP